MKNIFSLILIIFLLTGCNSVKAGNTNSITETKTTNFITETKHTTSTINTSISLSKLPESYTSIEKVKNAKKNKNSDFLNNKDTIFILNDDAVTAPGSFKVGEYVITSEYELKNGKKINFTQQEFDDVDFAFKDTISRSSGENTTMNGQTINISRDPEVIIATFIRDTYLCTLILDKDVSDKDIEKLIKAINKIDLNN